MLKEKIKKKEKKKNKKIKYIKYEKLCNKSILIFTLIEHSCGITIPYIVGDKQIITSCVLISTIIPLYTSFSCIFSHVNISLSSFSSSFIVISLWILHSTNVFSATFFTSNTLFLNKYKYILYCDYIIFIIILEWMLILYCH